MSGSKAIDPGRQILLAKRLLEGGHITPLQLREALTNRSQGGGATSLEDLLVSKGFVTRQKLDQVLAALEGPKPDGPSPPSTAPAPPPAAAPPPAGPPTSSFIPRLGKYTLIRELGRGGMGVVYEALDVQLNRKVALKLMIRNPNADPQEATVEEERFIREAKLAAQLKHPNIVAVYEAGVLDGRRFLAMEIVEGKPYSTWRKQCTQTIRQQVAVLCDVALAVHHAHEQGVLHRDLKPRNVLIDANNHPYVTDFGLAKTLGKESGASLTASGMVVGTPTYMSPEQCQGTGRIDWRSDIWSLGVMLYEVLAGKPPFSGDSPIEIMSNVVRNPVVPPGKVALDGAALALDGTIENICLKALAKDPKERYATAKVFADDLAKWVSGQSVKVSSPPKRRKLPYRILLEAAGLVVILAAGAAVYLATRPSVKPKLERAQALMQQGDYAEAVIAFREALAVDPANKAALAGEAEARRREHEKKARLKDDLETKLKEADRWRREVEEKLRAAKTAATDADRERIAAELRAAEERAIKAETSAGKIVKILSPTAPEITPAHSATRPAEPSWALAVDLLPLAQPGRDSLWGKWSLRDGRLLSDATPHARIEIPYELPDEYDIRLTFSRLAGTDSVGLILSYKGSPFALEMGASRNKQLTLVPPSTREEPDSPTSHRTICIENNRFYTAAVRVRHDGVQAFLDGLPVLEWNGDPARLGSDPRWNLRNGRSPGLGSHSSPTAFCRLEILDISGPGRRLVPPPPPPLRPATTDAFSLQPGLTGEYFYGPSFDTLAIRRIDPAVSFDWQEGPAWAGGPAEAFSARWTGYLNAPTAGDAVFALAADGAARLLIDGTQVLTADASHRGMRRSAKRELEPGFHAITVEFFECGYRAGIQLLWATDEKAKPTLIRPESLFHDPAAFKSAQVPLPHELIGTLQGHANSVTALDFAPDGLVLASAGEDGRLRLWEAERRRLLGAVGGHMTGLLAVALSPDGRLMASGGYDRKVRLWDVERRAELRTLQGHHGFIRSLAFSPDGRWLASGSFDRTILLWDTVTGKEIRMLGSHADGCTAVAFSPDGTRIASAGADRLIRLWDPKKGIEVCYLPGHADSVEALAFSPDGRSLASASKDSTIKIWDVEKGAELHTLAGHHGEALCVAFHPDGKILASGGGDSVIRLWDTATGNEVRVLAGHAGLITCLDFAPGGRFLASGCTDMTIRLWDFKQSGR